MTNRISLNIALKHLNVFERNEGLITNILFSIRNNINDNVISAGPFEDINMLHEYIKIFTQPSKRDLSCSPLLLFELKKFTIFNNNTNRNLVYNTDGIFITKSSNISAPSMLGLNTTYFQDFKEVKNIYTKLNVSEYILKQITYIECGYLEGYNKEDLEKLQKLYNKYNQ
jgi:hypothetical protein